jgi:hypothetical protein
MLGKLGSHNAEVEESSLSHQHQIKMLALGLARAIASAGLLPSSLIERKENSRMPGERVRLIRCRSIRVAMHEFKALAAK